MKKLIIGLVIVIVFGTAGFISQFKNKITDEPAANNLDSFARCLTEKKITMYGASWCPHCQAQKKMFGDSFRLVQYVECPENIKLCFEKGVQLFPTWIFDDGRKFEGAQSLEKLSELSVCALPVVK